MVDLYEINKRCRQEKESKADDELEDQLNSARNMIDLAMLALYDDSRHLISTAIEEAYYKLQSLVEDYCIIDE